MLHPVIASREVTRYILDTFGLIQKNALDRTSSSMSLL